MAFAHFSQAGNFNGALLRTRLADLSLVDQAIYADQSPFWGKNSKKGGWGGHLGQPPKGV